MKNLMQNLSHVEFNEKSIEKLKERCIALEKQIAKY